MDWKNSVVLLTGASSGIGEGVAIELAKRGATLGLIARRADMLHDLARRCVEAGGKAVAFPCDVTDADALQRAADALRSEFGRIDILIANAGIGGNNPETRDLQPVAVKKSSILIWWAPLMPFMPFFRRCSSEGAGSWLRSRVSLGYADYQSQRHIPQAKPG